MTDPKPALSTSGQETPCYLCFQNVPKGADGRHEYIGSNGGKYLQSCAAVQALESQPQDLGLKIDVQRSRALRVPYPAISLNRRRKHGKQD